MAKDFFIKKELDSHLKEISASVSRWIGVLKTKKSYKELRDEYISSRLYKYESTD